MVTLCITTDVIEDMEKFLSIAREHIDSYCEDFDYDNCRGQIEEKYVWPLLASLCKVALNSSISMGKYTLLSCKVTDCNIEAMFGTHPDA